VAKQRSPIALHNLIWCANVFITKSAQQAYEVYMKLIKSKGFVAETFGF